MSCSLFQKTKLHLCRRMTLC